MTKTDATYNMKKGEQVVARAVTGKTARAMEKKDDALEREYLGYMSKQEREAARDAH